MQFLYEKPVCRLLENLKQENGKKPHKSLPLLLLIMQIPGKRNCSASAMVMAMLFPATLILQLNPLLMMNPPVSCWSWKYSFC
ncbi:hypothetical protein BD408DRAFT_424589 [Parasitella parasitica]|nr:hypothetical protein BD408DRAFT_424589 [Parasitella parasitica]